MIRGSLRRRLLLIVLIAAIPAFVIHIAIQVMSDIRVARVHTDTDTRTIAAAAVPLLKSALIVGDLATAQETLDRIADHGGFHTLKLLDDSDRHVLAEGRPSVPIESSAVPNWFVAGLNVHFAMQTFPVTAGGTHYGTLMIEPSSLFLVADIWVRIWTAVAIWLVSLSCFALMLRLTLRHSLRPFEDLAAAARSLGEGDLSSRAPIGDVPELAETAIAFNRMADNLAESRAQLEARVRQATSDLENLITRIPVGVYKLRIRPDDTMCFDFTSPRWCELIELDAETLNRDPKAPLLQLHPDEPAGFIRQFNAARAGMTHFQWEGRLRDGLRVRWLRIEAMPTALDNGDVLWEGIQYDISARKQAEESLRTSEEKLRGLYELSPLGIALTDMEGHYIEFNEAFRTICGYPADELRHLDYWTLTPRKYEADEQRQLESLRRTGRYGPYEKEYRRKDGSLVPLSFNGMLVEGSDGDPLIWSIVEDITRQKVYESILQQTIGELNSLIARIPAGVYKLRMLADGDMRFDYVSPRWCELLEISADEVYRDPRAPFARIHPDDIDLFTRLNEQARSTLTLFEWEGRLREGMCVRWLHVESTPTLQDNGDILWEGIQYDITATKVREEELDRIAHYDPLTGIPNRMLLADRMQQAIAHVQRNRSSLAVCYIDLDGFKPINDALGHEAGDAVLVETAKRLLATVRGGDTVARIGGDEFVLLLTEIAHMGEYETSLKRVLDAVNAPIVVAGRVVSVSASIGISLYPQDDAAPDLLLRHADQAMYQAKQAGRNKFIFFDPNLEQAACRHREILFQIENGMAGNQFELYYQPKVNMRLGTVIGFEALVRWRHPDKGLMLPKEFLPLIEDNDLIVALGEWVIDRALTQIGIWRRQGLDMSVSVNIAPRQLQLDNFAERLKQRLALHADAPPDKLEIEIVETAALADTARVAHLIEQCRQVGVSFALDDFGTGYSSLTYLKSLPAQTLKIDQSFVRDMLVDSNDLAIVEGVIGLTEIFRRQVVAEGVETTEHGTLLLNMGCELAQGFGIASPMPADQVDAWLKNWKPDPAWSAAEGFRWPRDDLPLVVAQSNHRAWIEDIGRYINGSSDELPELDATHCRFGQWYAGNGRRRYGNITGYSALADVHARIHTLGHELVDLVACGCRPEAKRRMAELEALRDELLMLLQRLMASATVAL